MKTQPRLARLALLFGALLVAPSPLAAQVAFDDPLTQEPSWKIPSPADVRTQVLSWLDERAPEAEVRERAEALWPADDESANSDLLDRLIDTFATVDPRYQEITRLDDASYEGFAVPQFVWLESDDLPAFERNNLRLWLGRWLALEQHYDDALIQLKELNPDDVVDPVSLLFYQSVCHHWMLHKKEGLASIALLLEHRDELPRRYRQMAMLMHADLSQLEDDSLDHIARRMNDVTRRLDLGHAGKRIRSIEDGIIESLDKLIKKMEDQAQAQSGGGGGAGGSFGVPISPAQESRIAGGKGPGEVASKKIGNTAGWGDLPPKEREEALQQLSKDFPSHYRDVIEQYFRKLATESEEK